MPEIGQRGVVRKPPRPSAKGVGVGEHTPEGIAATTAYLRMYGYSSEAIKSYLERLKQEEVDRVARVRREDESRREMQALIQAEREEHNVRHTTRKRGQPSDALFEA